MKNGPELPAPARLLAAHPGAAKATAHQSNHIGERCKLTQDEFRREMSQFPVSRAVNNIDGLAAWMVAVEGLLAGLLAATSHDGKEIKHLLTVGDGVEVGIAGVNGSGGDAVHFNNCLRRVKLLLRYRFGIEVS